MPGTYGQTVWEIYIHTPRKLGHFKEFAIHEGIRRFREFVSVQPNSLVCGDLFLPPGKFMRVVPRVPNSVESPVAASYDDLGIAKYETPSFKFMLWGSGFVFCLFPWFD